MSKSEAYMHGQLGYREPPPRMIQWLGAELVLSSLLLHWPKGISDRSPGPVLVGRLGLDPLNTAWHHRRTKGTAFAISPLRRHRLNVTTVPADFWEAAGK